MAKTLYGHRIGANIREQEAATGVNIVPDNKTLIILPFNNTPDDDIEPVRLKSLKDLFAYYTPETEVDFKTADGGAEEIKLRFNNLKDFTKDGIIEQSDILQDLEDQENIYSRMLDVLNNNEKLIGVLSKEETKKEFIELLQTLIDELNENTSE